MKTEHRSIIGLPTPRHGRRITNAGSRGASFLMR